MTTATAESTPGTAAGAAGPSGLRLDEAIDRVAADFPFERYVGRVRRGAVYPVISSTMRRILPEGGRVLDVGAGGCDTAAVLAHLGYEAAAMDDFQDAWHMRDGNWRHIVAFARRNGVDARRVLDPTEPWPWPEASFDVVMSHDVLEHLHDSPRGMLETCWSYVKPGGYLFLTMPNAGNVLKRYRLLRGGTNLPDFGYFYWCGTPWRGHVREYVRGDLERIARYLGLEVVELRDVDTILSKFLTGPKRLVYDGITGLVPGLRSSWLFVGRKTPGSEPLRDAPDEPNLRVLRGRWDRALRSDAPPLEGDLAADDA